VTNKFRVQDGIIFPDGTEQTTSGLQGIQGIQGLQGISYNQTLDTNSNVSFASLTSTGDISGTTLISSYSAGNEGGEIHLAQAATSTLGGDNIIIDSYANRLRIFESGGSSRGAYIDLSQSSASVGTLLNNRIGGYVNAGTYVTMDNLKATVSTSGNRSLQIATVSGSFSSYIVGTYTLFNGGVAGTGATLSVTTTPALALNWNFVSAGDSVNYIISDITNNLCYRVTMIIGGSYNNNMISIERLV